MMKPTIPENKTATINNPNLSTLSSNDDMDKEALVVSIELFEKIASVGAILVAIGVVIEAAIGIALIVKHRHLQKIQETEELAFIQRVEEFSGFSVSQNVIGVNAFPPVGLIFSVKSAADAPAHATAILAAFQTVLKLPNSNETIFTNIIFSNSYTGTIQIGTNFFNAEDILYHMSKRTNAP